MTLYCQAWPYVVYIYVPYFQTWRVHGRFYVLDLGKKGNGRLGKLAIDTLDSSLMKETAADSKAKRKKPGSTCGLLGKGCWSFIQTELLNSSKHLHWM